jgi:hypothetical protein
MIVTVPGWTVMRHLAWETMWRIREVMRIGFHLAPFWSPTDRPPSRIIDEAIAVVAAASRMGFEWVSIGQHWLSHPTVWPQPFPCWPGSPESGAMRLKTSVLLLPILNPVEVAECGDADHIATAGSTSAWPSDTARRAGDRRLRAPTAWPSWKNRWTS